MELLDALRRTRELLAESCESGWSVNSVQQLERRLDTLIRSVEAGRRPRFRLGWLYRPTGDLQEVSLDSGWGPEFVALAEVVDAFVRGDRR